jgi:hypothetical protein
VVETHINLTTRTARCNDCVIQIKPGSGIVIDHHHCDVCGRKSRYFRETVVQQNWIVLSACICDECYEYAKAPYWEQKS